MAERESILAGTGGVRVRGLNSLLRQLTSNVHFVNTSTQQRQQRLLELGRRHVSVKRGISVVLEGNGLRFNFREQKKTRG